MNIYKYRQRGYREALHDYGIPFDEQLLRVSKIQMEDGIEEMESMLAEGLKPDAIFAASDYSAMGAMQVIRKEGLKIPDDIALVGFADEPFASFVEPKLSSVNQLSEEMGHFAAKLFLEQVVEKGQNFVPRKTVLTPLLMERESSKKKKE